jgi:hypothetical protein
VLLTVLAQRGRHGFVEKRQVEILDIDNLKLGIAPPLRDVVDPAADGVRLAARTRTPDDDREPDHLILHAGAIGDWRAM